MEKEKGTIKKGFQMDIISSVVGKVSLKNMNKG